MRKTDHKRNLNSGFTLAELLVVVAIIAVLVAIAIPIFTSQLEKSREATDLDNVRSAYAEIMVEVVTEGEIPSYREVDLKQKKDDWDTPGTINIAGITKENQKQWIGIPKANGKCTITYDPSVGIIFNWNGRSTAVIASGLKLNIHNKIREGKTANSWFTGGTVKKFELDSTANSKMLNELKPILDKDPEKSELIENGTWAYLADTRADSYYAVFLWTCVDVTEIGAGKPIPVLVSPDKNSGGGYYISSSKTSQREQSEGGHITIAKHMYNGKSDLNKFAEGTRYETLEEAYKAYVKVVEENYPEYVNMLLQ